MKESRIIIHTYKPTSGEKQVKYIWEGPIDGEIHVADVFLDDELFLSVPFKLKRLKNFDYRTAVFIRVDWRARIVRLLRRR